MYRFIPAAINWHTFGGLGAYVRYGTYPNKIVVKQADSNMAWLQCPDREVVLVREQHRATSWRPAGENFDEYVSFDLFDDKVSADGFDLDFFMTNYIHTELTTCPNNKQQGYKGGAKIVTDSGGFQVAMGKVDWIDPVQLVRHYNNNSDIGIGLDIPIWSNDDKMLMRAAKVQKLNLITMLKHKRKDLELLNPVHGGSPEKLRSFYKLVRHPDVNRIAVAGTQDGTLVAGIDTLLEAYVGLGQKFDQVHVLGVYNIAHMLPIIWAANSFGDRLLTSDASTALMSANNKMYHTQHDMFSPVRRLRIGDIGTRPSPHNVFPCQCPVCKTLKYVDILSVLDGGLYRHTLMMHNIWEINRYSKMMDDLASTLNVTEFKEVCRSQLQNHRDTKSSLAAIDFVQQAATDSLSAARRTYHGLIIRDSLYIEEKPMFEEGTDQNEYEELTVEQRQERINQILAEYESRIARDSELRPKKEGKKVRGLSRRKSASRMAKTAKAGSKKLSQKTKKSKKTKKAK